MSTSWVRLAVFRTYGNMRTGSQGTHVPISSTLAVFRYIQEHANGDFARWHLRSRGLCPRRVVADDVSASDASPPFFHRRAFMSVVAGGKVTSEALPRTLRA